MKLRHLLAPALMLSLAPSASDALSITLQRIDGDGERIGPRSSTTASGGVGSALINGADLGVSGFSVTADAQTKPILPAGGALDEALQLVSGLDVVNNDGEMLLFEMVVSESGYSFDDALAEFDLEGSGNFENFASESFTADVATYVDMSDTEYAGAAVGDLLGAATQVGSEIALSGAAVSGDSQGSTATDGTFSVTQRAVIGIAGTGTGDLAFDSSAAAAGAAAVPLPAGLGLLLSGLGGFALLRRRSAG